MAYETGAASNIGDLISKLCTFATGLSTTPWTQDELATYQATLHRGNCYVSFMWAAAPNTYGLAIYQSLGYTSSTHPSGMPDDSGCGTTGTNPTTLGQRWVNFTDGAGNNNSGPFTAYHFFAGEGSEPYIYVVVEMASGLYRHFGFGNLVKRNDFTGGEFVYGHHWYNNVAYRDNPTANFHTFLMDGVDAVYPNEAASVHLEGFPGQAVGGKWGVCTSAAPGNDRAGVARLKLFGTARSGGYGYHLLWMRASQLGSYKLLVPVTLLYRDDAPTPDVWRWLGEMPGMTLVNMHHFSPGDEITVGSDTYMIFPWIRKRYQDDGNEESRNAGVAYLKVA